MTTNGKVRRRVRQGAGPDLFDTRTDQLVAVHGQADAPATLETSYETIGRIWAGGDRTKREGAQYKDPTSKVRTNQ